MTTSRGWGEQKRQPPRRCHGEQCQAAPHGDEQCKTAIPGNKTVHEAPLNAVMGMNGKCKNATHPHDAMNEGMNGKCKNATHPHDAMNDHARHWTTMPPKHDEVAAISGNETAYEAPLNTWRSNVKPLSIQRAVNSKFEIRKQVTMAQLLRRMGRPWGRMNRRIVTTTPPGPLLSRCEAWHSRTTGRVKSGGSTRWELNIMEKEKQLHGTRYSAQEHV